MAISPAVMGTFDEWDSILGAAKSEKPVEYLNYNSNPLELVCAMLRTGKQGYEIGETLNGVGTRVTNTVTFKHVVEKEDADRANEILNYFAKKHTMRRVKGEWISKYMLAIDDIIENPRRLNKEHLPVLISLPRIYDQNRSLERVLKGHTSIPSKPSATTLDFPPFSGEVSYVDTVHVKTSRHNEMHYFFRMPKNYLMRVVVKTNEYGANAWNFIAQQGKIHIETDNTFVMSVKGYDFNVMQPSPSNLNITTV